MGGVGITEELRGELAAIAEYNGCEFVHAEFKGGTLRLFLDRPTGLGLGDCEAVSKQVSALLDVLDFGRGRYTLEVSSPGLDRELYGPRDYARFVGRRVRIRFRQEADGRPRTVVGRLAAFAPAESSIRLEEVDGAASLEIPLRAVELARLEIEL